MLDISAKPFADYHGTYADYLKYIGSNAPQTETAAPKNPDKEENKKRYEKEKQDRSDKRKLISKIERQKKETEQIETRLDEIEKEYKEYELDYKKLMELDGERAELEDRLLQLYTMTDEDERLFESRFGKTEEN